MIYKRKLLLSLFVCLFVRTVGNFMVEGQILEHNCDVFLEP